MADPRQHLPMDRRLLGRRGFVSTEERDQHIANLPDVTEKGEMIDLPGAPSDGADAAAEAAPAAGPPGEPAGGTGGGFGGDDTGGSAGGFGQVG